MVARTSVRHVGAARPPHRLGPRRDPRVDDAVLDAARRSLVELGYASTTLDGVARRAGVSRPTIYRRWGSKAELVRDAILPSAPPTHEGERTVAEEVALVVREMVGWLAQAPARAAVPGLIAELRDDPELVALFEAHLEAHGRRRFATEVLAPAAARGEVCATVDADVVLDAITGAVLVATCVRHVDDLDAYVASLTSLLLDGIVSPSSRPAAARKATGHR